MKISIKRNQKNNTFFIHTEVTNFYIMSLYFK